MAFEQLRGKPIVGILDPAYLDEGKQTKRAHVPDRIGPREFSIPAANASEKGVAEMRSGGDIQGVTSQGACAETVCAIGKVGDNYFDNLLGKPARDERVV